MIHNQVSSNIKALMERLSFPENAQAELFSSLDKMLNDNDAANELDAVMSMYDESEFCDYAGMLERIELAGKGVGVHEYTAQMLLYLSLSERLKERYIERSIDLDIFYDSLKDLSYKLEECHLIYNIVGSFTKNWFYGFYNLTRFALGRLQFEIRQYDVDLTIDGVNINKDTKVLNVHIPRTGGPLNHNEVLKSYDLAASFFAEELGETIIFHCSSWLLDPFHSTVLSPESNIMKFINDFTIIKTDVYTDYSSVWRLFDKMYNGNVDELPADSSLRRAYIERIKANQPTGWGRGFMVYKK